MGIILRSIGIGISLIILAVVLVVIILWEGKQREENATPSYLKETPTISDPEDARGSQTDDDSTDSPIKSDPKKGDFETIDLEDCASAGRRVNDTEGVHSDRSFGRMESMESIPMD